LAADTIQIPVDLCQSGSDLFVVSLSLPRTHFKDPFFIDSLAKFFPFITPHIKTPDEDETLARPLYYNKTDRRVIYTHFKTYTKLHCERELDNKLGFIFHMSRCGSTLASQMLASNDRFFVLSEPTIINAILDPILNITPNDRSQLLYACIAALLACSPVMCERMFIKFRSWNVLYLNDILKEVPNVGWLFIHRHGLEVLASVLEKPPGWLRSRRRYASYFSYYLNARQTDMRTMSNDEYSARMLGAFCRVVNDATWRRKAVLDYKNFKTDFVTVISQLWQIEMAAEDKYRVNRVSRLYSKDVNKVVQFKPDSLIKRKKASPLQREYVERFVEGERKRLANIQT
jgi:hypothetical protein